MPFEFETTEFEGLIVVKPKAFGDERGFFMETYQKGAFESAGIRGDFVQDNHSKSTRGVLRGLHFQKGKFAQAKLVRCTKGEVFDVAVDLRKNSKTYGKVFTIVLSETNKKMLYVPRGFAHGFIVTSEEAEFMYKVDNDYSPQNEGGIMWNDPDLNIPWPLKDPTLSPKDQKWPLLKDLTDQF